MGNHFSEGRASDSPYLETIWRGRAGPDYAPICPADSRWNLVFLKGPAGTHIYVEGPITKARPKTHAEGTEWIAIKFALGAYLSSVAISTLLDAQVVLSEAESTTFWLDGTAWRFPNYHDVEPFVNRLVRADVVLRDPDVTALLQDHSPAQSLRTSRRRLVRATGLAPKAIAQIARAQQAAALLEQGASIGEVVYQAGYADQPHLTRSLKRFIGYTPAQLAQLAQSE